MNNHIALTMAINDYDHTRELVSGDVAVEGVDLTCLRLPVEEIFWRFAHYQEWEISEFSFAKYCTLRGSGDTSVIALPVFTSRAFRHSAIFIRPDGPLDDPGALRGKRIGIPEWTQTATVYARGLLEDEFGVELTDVEWVQAGTNEPGRKEGVTIDLPRGVTLTAEPERTLNEMLINGDIDAMIAAHPPTDFKLQSGKIVQLFTDTRAVEEKSYRETGVFPVMHCVAIRADVYERHPWVAKNLYKAFEFAKSRSLERALDINAPRYPIPWAPANAIASLQLFGADPWPYGVEPNRRTLETFLRYCQRQGLCPAGMSVESLFAPEVLTSFVI